MTYRQTGVQGGLGLICRPLLSRYIVQTSSIPLFHSEPPSPDFGVFLRCSGSMYADSMSFDGKYVASSAFVKKPLPLGRRTINDDFSTANSLYGGRGSRRFFLTPPRTPGETRSRSACAGRTLPPISARTGAPSAASFRGCAPRAGSTAAATVCGSSIPPRSQRAPRRRIGAEKNERNRKSERELSAALRRLTG